MKFKIDENLPVEAAESLRQMGYEATMVLEQGLVRIISAPLATRRERRTYEEKG
jgi:uncharacterized DUF497 family protein